MLNVFVPDPSVESVPQTHERHENTNGQGTLPENDPAALSNIRLVLSDQEIAFQNWLIQYDAQRWVRMHGR